MDTLKSLKDQDLNYEHTSILTDVNKNISPNEDNQTFTNDDLEMLSNENVEFSKVSQPGPSKIEKYY